MCGACGASGPIASYYEGDVVEITHPPIDERETIAKVVSVNDEWGIELLFSASGSVKWVEWEPFTCRVKHPEFRIARVDEGLFEMTQRPEEGKGGYDNVTIGQGWLKKPYVLPNKNLADS